MIVNEYLRFGKLMPKPRAIIDTLIIAKKLNLPRPHRLGDLCKRYGVYLENAHDAGADAKASLQLLWEIMKSEPKPFRRPLEDLQTWLSSSEYNDNDDLGRGYNDLEPFDTDGKIRISDNDLIIIFGRHRGATLQQLRDTDEKYLNWLVSPNGPFQDDDRERLRNHINMRYQKSRVERSKGCQGRTSHQSPIQM